VRKLDQELGVKLVGRSQRSVGLTVAGAALLEEAQHVLRHAEVAQQAARNAGDLATTRLRIGYLRDSPHERHRGARSAVRVCMLVRHSCARTVGRIRQSGARMEHAVKLRHLATSLIATAVVAAPIAGCGNSAASGSAQSPNAGRCKQAVSCDATMMVLGA